MSADRPTEARDLTQVVDALRVRHPVFVPETIRRLVARVAADHGFLAGTAEHGVVVHDEVDRQLSYVAPVTRHRYVPRCPRHDAAGRP